MAIPYGPLSLNEVLFFVTRATVGAGAPFGLGEDVGKAAVILATSGIDPALAIAPALQRLENESCSGNFDLRNDDRGVVIEAVGGHPLSAIFAASAASDWMQENAGHTDAGVTVVGVDAPVVFAAVFEALHRSAGRAQISVVEPDATETALVISGDPAEFERSANLTVSAGPPSTPVFANRDGHALENGISVDADAWGIIRKMFSRCLVPSTEESRLTGAGAGLVDTD